MMKAKTKTTKAPVAVAAVETLMWGIKNVKTGKIVDVTKSRTEARDLKMDGQVVVKVKIVEVK